MEHRTEPADQVGTVTQLDDAVGLQGAPALPKSRKPAAQAMQLASNYTPPQLLALYIERGQVDPEMLNKMMDLADRFEAKNAKRAFDAALAEAKAEIKPILKNRRVDFLNRNNTRTQYEYEDLAAIAEHVDPILAKVGLSYRHKPRQDDVTSTLYVTCILAHRDGHTEETELHGPYDTSGNKNPVQAIASVGTFLQRYTLRMALGLASAHDDDGQGAGDSTGTEESPALVTQAQVQELRQLLKAGGHNERGFLQHIGAPNLESIYARSFDALKAEILARRPATRSPTAGAEKVRMIDLAQLEHLRKQIDKAGVREVDLLRRYEVDQLEALPYAQLQPALTWLAGVNR